MGQQSVGYYHVGEYLAQLLKERDATISQVAEATGLPQDVMACVVAGRQILTADIAFMLADVLELSPLVLLELQRRCCLDARDREVLRPSLAA